MAGIDAAEAGQRASRPRRALAVANSSPPGALPDSALTTMGHERALGDEVHLGQHEHDEGPGNSSRLRSPLARHEAHRRPAAPRTAPRGPARPPAAVDDGAEQRRHHREGRHGKQQVEDHLAPRLVGRDAEEQRAGQRHRHQGVPRREHHVGERQAPERGALVEQGGEGVAHLTRRCGPTPHALDLAPRQTTTGSSPPRHHYHDDRAPAPRPARGRRRHGGDRVRADPDRGRQGRLRRTAGARHRRRGVRRGRHRPLRRDRADRRRRRSTTSGAWW